LIKMIGDHVLLKPRKKEQVGGIYLPEAKVEFFEVVDVGDGIPLPNGTYAPVDVHVGDIVLVPEHVGVEYEDGDTTYVIARLSDIDAVVEE